MAIGFWQFNNYTVTLLIIACYSCVRSQVIKMQHSLTWKTKNTHLTTFSLPEQSFAYLKNINASWCFSWKKLLTCIMKCYIVSMISILYFIGHYLQHHYLPTNHHIRFGNIHLNSWVVELVCKAIARHCKIVPGKNNEQFLSIILRAVRIWK